MKNYIYIYIDRYRYIYIYIKKICIHLKYVKRGGGCWVGDGRQGDTLLSKTPAIYFIFYNKNYIKN